MKSSNAPIDLFTYLLTLLLLVGGVSSCSMDDIADEPEESAQLRIENLSNFALKSVKVIPGGGGQRTYTNIPSGELSGYQSFHYIYEYAFVQVVVGNDTLTIEPIDYVGEEQLFNGFFTYQIDVIAEQQGVPGLMTLEFKED